MSPVGPSLQMNSQNKVGNKSNKQKAQRGAWASNLQ